MNCLWASATHKGFGPEINQDRVFPLGAGRSADPVVVMVADGLGGERFGHVSADLAVKTVQSTGGSPADRARAANQAILDLVRAKPRWKGTYTTLTLVEFVEGQARLAHIGDTRAYLFRDNRARLMTNDHTVAWHRIQQGIDPHVAYQMARPDSLIRVLGFDDHLEVEEVQVNSRAGDRWLLCSDGLYRMMPDQEIGQILAKGGPEECVWDLMEAALDRGASDNVTAVVVDLTS